MVSNGSLKEKSIGMMCTPSKKGPWEWNSKFVRFLFFNSLILCGCFDETFGVRSQFRKLGRVGWKDDFGRWKFSGDQKSKNYISNWDPKLSPLTPLQLILLFIRTHKGSPSLEYKYRSFLQGMPPNESFRLGGWVGPMQVASCGPHPEPIMDEKNTCPASEGHFKLPLHGQVWLD